MRVYIAGPYSQGDTVLNVRAALEAAEMLISMGHIPYVPHLTHFWHLVFPHEHEYWMELDMKWLVLCNAFVRLPGPSIGADREVAMAEKLGLKRIDLS